MRLIPASLLVGATVLGLGAFALPAAGKDPAVHQMTIQLPDGGTETIRYTGEVAPKVSFVETPFAIAWPAPGAFGFEPTFAAFDRIAADMDRQMGALWQQAATLQNWSNGGDLSKAALQTLGPGGSAYTMVTESFGNSVCTRMTQIISSPNGEPKVVSRTSSNCNASPVDTGTAPNTSSARTIADQPATPATAVQRTAL